MLQFIFFFVALDVLFDVLIAFSVCFSSFFFFVVFFSFDVCNRLFSLFQLENRLWW